MAALAFCRRKGSKHRLNCTVIDCGGDSLDTNVRGAAKGVYTQGVGLGVRVEWD